MLASKNNLYIFFSQTEEKRSKTTQKTFTSPKFPTCSAPAGLLGSFHPFSHLPPPGPRAALVVTDQIATTHAKASTSRSHQLEKYYQPDYKKNTRCAIYVDTAYEKSISTYVHPRVPTASLPSLFYSGAHARCRAASGGICRRFTPRPCASAPASPRTASTRAAATARRPSTRARRPASARGSSRPRARRRPIPTRATP